MRMVEERLMQVVIKEKLEQGVGMLADAIRRRSTAKSAECNV